jgi:two-component system, NarL family, sensor histidine kinase UhpB
MTALRLKIESLLKKFGDVPEHNPAIAEVQAAAKTIDQDIGFLSWELRPTELDQFGLENALATFVREWSGQYGVQAEFHAEVPEFEGDGRRLSKTAETNLYRIAQEGLNNILKHADATNVTVLLQQRNNDMLLIIEDDGRGFAEKGNGSGKLVKPRGLGLIGMKERAALLKGTLNVDSQPGGGTSILARIPLDFETN